MRKILTYCLPLALIFMSVTETHAISGEKAKQEKARLEAAALAGAVAGAALPGVIGAVNTIIDHLPVGHDVAAALADGSNLVVVLGQIDAVVAPMGGQAALVAQAVIDMNTLIKNLLPGHDVAAAGPENLQIPAVDAVVTALGNTVAHSITEANTIREGLRADPGPKLNYGPVPPIDSLNLAAGLRAINDNVRADLEAHP